MTDKDLIKALGGPAKVAELLGYDKAQGGVQRVQNWLDRGIPSKVKLDHPHIFLRAHAPQGDPVRAVVEAKAGV